MFGWKKKAEIGDVEMDALLEDSIAMTERAQERCNVAQSAVLDLKTQLAAMTAERDALNETLRAIEGRWDHLVREAREGIIIALGKLEPQPPGAPPEPEFSLERLRSRLPGPPGEGYKWLYCQCSQCLRTCADIRKHSLPRIKQWVCGGVSHGWIAPEHREPAKLACPFCEAGAPCMCEVEA